MVLLAVLATVVGLIFFPIGGNNRQGAMFSACLSNTKQLALAAILYSFDYDDLGPGRDEWAVVVQHYTRDGKAVKCTVLQKGPPDIYGFAYNSTLAGQSLTKVPNPETRPLIYESLNLARNASDPYGSVPDPGRHTGKTSVAFVDGHAKGFKAADALNFKPESRDIAK